MKGSFQLIVKDGIMTVAAVAGKTKTEIDENDLQKVIEVEQWLERLFGFRFHINAVAPVRET